MNQKGERQLIEVGKAKKALQRVRSWFYGFPPNEQDRLAQAVVKMCIEEIEKISPVNAVELPCKIGDFVWAIRNFNGHKHPQRGIVGDMYFTRDMKLHIVVKYVARGEWGKTVFATDKEAYAAIEERRADV